MQCVIQNRDNKITFKLRMLTVTFLKIKFVRKKHPKYKQKLFRCWKKEGFSAVSCKFCMLKYL